MMKSWLPSSVGIVSEAGPHGDGFAALLESEAIGPHGGEMGSAGHQRYIRFAFVGQARADVSTDGAGTEYAYAGHARPSFWARPMRCSLPVAPLGISATMTILRGTLKAARR